MDLDYYMSLPYKIEITKDTDEEGYVAFIPELKGCITQDSRKRMRLRTSRMQRQYGSHQHWKMEIRFQNQT